MSKSSPEVASSAARNQRTALIAVVGVVVVGALAYLLLFSGNKSSNTGAVVPSRPHVQSSAVASDSPAAAVAAIPAAYAGAIGRNPFQPATTPPATPAASSGAGAASASGAGASGAASKSASPTPTPTVIVIPTLSLPPTSTPTPTPTVTVTATPTPTGLPTAGQPITLTLTRVDNSGTVDVSVAKGGTTTPYLNVAPGQIFGTYFKLVSLVSSDPANPPVQYGADFEYGDQFLQLVQGESAQLG